MEGYNQTTQVTLRKGIHVQGTSKTIKSSKNVKEVANQNIEALDLLDKQLDIEMGVVNAPKIQIISNSTKPINKIKEIISESLKIKAQYSCGGAFLQGIQIYYIQPSQTSGYKCQKMRSFSCSQYKISHQQGGKRKQYQLISNFMGTRYDLKDQGKTIMTIIYDLMFNISSACRRFNIYALNPSSSWDQLQGTNETLDLKELYIKYNNYEHLVNWTNIQPVWNPKIGSYMLNFCRKNVKASVNNSIISSLNGQMLMQFYEINYQQNTYQINKSSRVSQLWAIAYAISSLDFKIAIQ